MTNAADRTNGVSLLASYYQMSGLVFKGTTFQQFEDFYDNRSPNFIESLGYAQRISGLSPAEFTSVLQDIASQNTGEFPDYRDFIPAVIDKINGVSHTLVLIKDATVQSVKQAATIAGVAGGSYLIIVGTLAALIFLHEMDGARAK